MVPIFIISLARSRARRNVILTRIRDLGLSAEVFPAIDGRDPGEEGKRYRGRRHRLLYGRDMFPGEIGCALSHRALCAEIFRRGIERALVLEDDAILTDRLPAVLSGLEDSAARWDLVRFLGKAKDVKRVRRIATIGEGTTLCRSYGTPGGAHGYVVNRLAARRFAECAETIWMPIDLLQGQVWLHRLRVRCVLPPPVEINWYAESTIAGNVRFSKDRKLAGWEGIAFPFTRLGFKVLDAAAKHTTFYGGVLRDTFTRK